MGYIEFSSVEEKNKAWELNGSDIAGGSLYVDGNVKPRTPGGDFGGGRGGRGGRGGGCGCGLCRHNLRTGTVSPGTFLAFHLRWPTAPRWMAV